MLVAGVMALEQGDLGAQDVNGVDQVGDAVEDLENERHRRAYARRCQQEGRLGSGLREFLP